MPAWEERSGTDPMVAVVQGLVDEHPAPRPEALLLDALLWRGFLAFVDGAGEVRLAPGSHREDLDALAPLATVTPDPRGARISLRGGDAREQARRIATLATERTSRWTGLPMLTKRWATYRAQAWGHQVPVCGDPPLDVGIALVVKALPLLRCFSILSCDGHGERDPIVTLRTGWDALWGEAVMAHLPVRPRLTRWRWSTGSDDEGRLRILARADARATFLDLQRVARAWLDHDVVARVGRGRRAALAALGEAEPTPEAFRAAAFAALADAFAGVSAA